VAYGKRECATKILRWGRHLHRVGEFIMGWANNLRRGRIIVPPVGGFISSKSSPWGRNYHNESFRSETFSR